MIALSDNAKELLDGKNLAHFVTLMKNGSPQVTPVWVDHDGTYVLINTAEGRQKPRNLERDNRVALSVVDSESPFKYVQIRGRVVEVTQDGAWDHICKLCEKYTGTPNYPKREGETRIIVKIAPEHESGTQRPGTQARGND